jgi:hypothetical protein
VTHSHLLKPSARMKAGRSGRAPGSIINLDKKCR